jgi:hypothetical protein
MLYIFVYIMRGNNKSITTFGSKMGLDGKHGVGVPESEPRSRSPGVPESDVIKIWKTRSHMENTESDVREKYGKHGV